MWAFLCLIFWFDFWWKAKDGHVFRHKTLTIGGEFVVYINFLGWKNDCMRETFQSYIMMVNMMPLAAKYYIISCPIFIMAHAFYDGRSVGVWMTTPLLHFTTFFCIKRNLNWWIAVVFADFVFIKCLSYYICCFIGTPYLHK